MLGKRLETLGRQWMRARRERLLVSRIGRVVRPVLKQICHGEEQFGHADRDFTGAGDHVEAKRSAASSLVRETAGATAALPSWP